MESLTSALLTDGPSDRALIPILTWLLRQHLGRSSAISCDWVDMGRLRQRPASLSERIRLAVDLQPCDLLFVHRDAESADPEHRYREINRALVQLQSERILVPCVCVVPVRMTEAWLLMNESSIRDASGNPHGRMPLALPRQAEIESLVDPKEKLHALLTQASGYHGRRRKKFRARVHVYRISEHASDHSCLRALPSFRRLEADVRTYLASH